MIDKKSIYKSWQETSDSLFSDKVTPSVGSPYLSDLGGVESTVEGRNASGIDRVFAFLGAGEQAVQGGIRGVQEIQQESRSGNFNFGDIFRPIGGIFGGAQDQLAVAFDGKINTDIQKPEDVVTREYAMGRSNAQDGIDARLIGEKTKNMTAEELEAYRKSVIVPQYEKIKEESSIGEKVGRTAGDLGAYVAWDPWTYATGGVSAGIKALYRGAKGLKDLKKAEDLTDIEKAAEDAIANVPEGVTPGQAKAAQNQQLELPIDTSQRLNINPKPLPSWLEGMNKPQGEIPGQGNLFGSAGRDAMEPKQLNLFDVPPIRQIPPTAEQQALLNLGLSGTKVPALPKAAGPISELAPKVPEVKPVVQEPIPFPETMPDEQLGLFPESAVPTTKPAQEAFEAAKDARRAVDSKLTTVSARIAQLENILSDPTKTTVKGFSAPKTRYKVGELKKQQKALQEELNALPEPVKPISIATVAEQGIKETIENDPISMLELAQKTNTTYQKSAPRRVEAARGKKSEVVAGAKVEDKVSESVNSLETSAAADVATVVGSLGLRALAKAKGITAEETITKSISDNVVRVKNAAGETYDIDLIDTVLSYMRTNIKELNTDNLPLIWKSNKAKDTPEIKALESTLNLQEKALQRVKDIESGKIAYETSELKERALFELNRNLNRYKSEINRLLVTASTSKPGTYVLQTIRSQISSVETKLAQASALYGKKSTEVKDLTTELKNLKKLEKQAQENLAKETAETSMAARHSNPLNYEEALKSGILDEPLSLLTTGKGEPKTFTLGELYEEIIKQADEYLQVNKGVRNALEKFDKENPVGSQLALFDATVVAKTEEQLAAVAQKAQLFEAKTAEEASKAAEKVEEVYKATKEVTPTTQSPVAPPHRVDVIGARGTSPVEASVDRLMREGVKPDDLVDDIGTISSKEKLASDALEKSSVELKLAIGSSSATNAQKAEVLADHFVEVLVKDTNIPYVNVNELKPNAVVDFFQPQPGKTVAELLNEGYSPKAIVVGEANFDKVQSKVLTALRALDGNKGNFWFNPKTKVTTEIKGLGRKELTPQRISSEGKPKNIYINVNPRTAAEVDSTVESVIVSASEKLSVLERIESKINDLRIPIVSDSANRIPMTVSSRYRIAFNDLATKFPEIADIGPGIFLLSTDALKALNTVGKLEDEAFNAINLLQGNARYLSGVPKNISNDSLNTLRQTFPSLIGDATSVRNPNPKPTMPSKSKVKDPDTTATTPTEAVSAQVKNIEAKSPKVPATEKQAETLGKEMDNSVANVINDSVETTVTARYTAEEFAASVGAGAGDEVATTLAVAAVTGVEKWARMLSARLGNYNLVDIVFNNLGVARRLSGEIEHFGKAIAGLKATKEETVNATNRLIQEMTPGFDAKMYSVLSPKEQAVYKELKLQIDSLFGATDSVLRSGNLSYEHIAKYLKAVGFEGSLNVKSLVAKNYDDTVHPFFQMLDNMRSSATGNVANRYGSMQDYFKEDPVLFMQQLSTAMFKGLGDKFVKHDLLYVVGKDTAEGLSQPVKVYGRFFEKDVAVQIPRMMEVMDDLLTFTAGGPDIIKKFDEIQSFWKTFVTIPIPGHHIRNMNGDLFMSFLASPYIGGNPAKMLNDYKDAVRILSGHQDWYAGVFKDPGSGFNAIIKGIDDKLSGTGNILPPMKSGKDDIVVFEIGGRRIMGSEAYAGGFNRGLFQMVHITEDLATGALESGNLSNKIQKIPYIKQMSGLSVSREHSVRMMDVVTELRYGLNKQFKGRKDIPQAEWDKAVGEILDRAAKKTRKLHPDGVNLTGFEKNVMRRLFPFYSYTRGIVPTFLEFAAMHPGRAMFPNHVYSAIQDNFYGRTVGNYDPNAPAVASWVYDSYPQGPLFGINTNSGRRAAVAVNPGVTSLDLPRQLVDPAGTLSSNLTPGIKVPLELLFRTDLRTRAPIEDYGDYALKNTPIVSPLVRGATGANPGAKPGSLPWLPALSQLGGLSAQEVNKPSYEKSAQFEQIRKKKKE